MLPNNYLFPTRTVNALNQITYANYDYHLGKPINTTDSNQVLTQYSYADPLDRLTQVRRAVGGGSALERSTSYVYYTPTWLITKTDQAQTNDNFLRNDTHTDGFGRVTQRLLYENPWIGHIASITNYDALGRVASTTNPSRPGDNLGVQTTYTYDALDRPTSVVHPGRTGADPDNLYL